MRFILFATLLISSLFNVLLGYSKISYDPYINTEGWKRVYIASYPRSGNHWLRYLIEEATGILTSSVYMDNKATDIYHDQLSKKWGGYYTKGGYEKNRKAPSLSESAFIKTHFPAHKATVFDTEAYTLALRLIRNPIDSIHSYFVYAHKPKKKWDSFLKNELKKWRKFHEYWDTQDRTQSITYESMIENPLSHLNAILLEQPLKDLQRAIKKYPPKDQPYKHLSHYSRKQKALVLLEVGDLLEKYGYEDLIELLQKP